MKFTKIISLLLVVHLLAIGVKPLTLLPSSYLAPKTTLIKTTLSLSSPVFLENDSGFDPNGLIAWAERWLPSLPFSSGTSMKRRARLLVLLLPLFLGTGCSALRIFETESDRIENVGNGYREIEQLLSQDDEVNTSDAFQSMVGLNEFIEDYGWSRTRVSRILQLRGLTRDIFIQYGTLIIGAGEQDLIQVLDAYGNLPSRHTQRIRMMAYGVNSRANEETAVAGTHLSFDDRLSFISFSRDHLERNNGYVSNGVLAHETGHSVHYSDLMTEAEFNVFVGYHEASTNEDDDFVSEYARTSPYEDFSETYSEWTVDSADLIGDVVRINFRGEITVESQPLLDKVLFIARLFLEKEGDQDYIRVFEQMNSYLIPLPDGVQFPEDFQRWHLSLLSNMVRTYKEETPVEPAPSYDYVIRTLEKYRNDERIVARIFYEQINQFVQNGRREDAYLLMYRLFNSEQSAVSNILREFFLLNRRAPIFAFRSEEITDLDRLEVVYYLSPTAVEEWLFTEGTDAFSQIRSIIPSNESTENPRSWPVLLVSLNDALIASGGTLEMERLHEILFEYGEGLAKLKYRFESIQEITSPLPLRLIHFRNPQSVGPYLQFMVRDLSDRQNRLMLGNGEEVNEEAITNIINQMMRMGTVRDLFSSPFSAPLLYEWLDDPNLAREHAFRNQLRDKVTSSDSFFPQLWQSKDLSVLYGQLQAEITGEDRLKQLIQESVSETQYNSLEARSETWLRMFQVFPEEFERMLLTEPQWLINVEPGIEFHRPSRLTARVLAVSMYISQASKSPRLLKHFIDAMTPEQRGQFYTYYLGWETRISPDFIDYITPELMLEGEVLPHHHLLTHLIEGLGMETVLTDIRNSAQQERESGLFGQAFGRFRSRFDILRMTLSEDDPNQVQFQALIPEFDALIRSYERRLLQERAAEEAQERETREGQSIEQQFDQHWRERVEQEERFQERQREREERDRENSGAKSSSIKEPKVGHLFIPGFQLAEIAL